MAEKMSPFDLAKTINGHQAVLDVSEVGYEPYVMNTIFSNTPDSVLFANEMNKAWGLPKQMQYDFYRHGLPKNPRRFGKWAKKEKDDDEVLAHIQEAYGYSLDKAKEVLPILQGQLAALENWNNKGGKK